MNIKKLAELAQVSKSTVSKALNGKTGVQEKTRELILNLAKTFDYRPNANAVALVRNKTGIIGLVVPHLAGYTIASPFWASLIQSVTKVAIDLGLKLLLLPPNKEGDLLGSFKEVLHNGLVDGIIIGSEVLDKKTTGYLLMQDLPFVLIGQNPHINHYTVDVDSYQGSRLMGEHLVSMGYKRIGLLTGPKDYYYTEERIRGVSEVLKSAGLKAPVSVYAEYNPGSEHEALSIINEKAQEIDALFILAGGEFFFDAMKIMADSFPDLLKKGIAVFDDYKLLDYFPPYVTAIRQPLEDVASHCVTMLAELIGNKVPTQKLVSLCPELVIRNTTRKVSN